MSNFIPFFLRFIRIQGTRQEEGKVFYNESRWVGIPRLNWKGIEKTTNEVR
jgi:hypothetical protein